MKSLSITRWSRRHDACGALLESYSEILEALEKFESDATKKTSARCEARGLMNSLDKLETAFMTVFWAYLLQPFSPSSKALQAADADISLAISLYKAMNELTSEMRTEADKFFGKFEEAAKNLLPGVDYQEVRQRRRTLRPEESRGDEETILDRRTNLKRNVFLPILGNVSTELKKRAPGYEAIYKKFFSLSNR